MLLNRFLDLTKYLVGILEDRFPLIKEGGGIDAVHSFKDKKGIIIFDVSMCLDGVMEQDILHFGTELM